MKRIAQIVSGLALLGLLVPPCLLYGGKWDLDQVKTWMLAATILWFLTAPLWMEHKATD